MKNAYAPVDLSVILHYHSSAVDHRLVFSGAPVASSVFNELCDDGLLTRNLNVGGTDGKTHYEPTARLHAFVEMLCVTPLPVMAYVDPRTNKVIQ